MIYGFLLGILTSAIVLYLYIGYKEIKHVIAAVKCYTGAKERRRLRLDLADVRANYYAMKEAFKRLRRLQSSSCVCFSTKECLVAYEEGKLIYQNNELIEAKQQQRLKRHKRF
jgi:hypothetical protein